nr:MAG TPA: hypothetical protein [Bacteriophage sp.]
MELSCITSLRTTVLVILQKTLIAMTRTIW